MVNPKDSIEFMLGQIVSNQEDMAKDITSIKKNQSVIMVKINGIEKKEAWVRGLAFGIGAIGGIVGSFIKGLFFATH